MFTWYLPVLLLDKLVQSMDDGARLFVPVSMLPALAGMSTVVVNCGLTVQWVHCLVVA
jgi:hypothetical protein